MLPYTYEGETISINLENGFTVIAVAKWNKEEKLYYTKFYINREDVEQQDLIVSDIKINAEIRNIRVTLARYITDKLDEGFYDYYIDRFNYGTKCFDIGNDIVETENINHSKGERNND